MYNVRVAMMAMGNMIVEGDHGQPAGFAGPLCLEIFSWYKNLFK